MNPVITKMEHFAVIVNSFQPFAIVAKSSILNIVGFLDPPLHCNKLATKAVGWFYAYLTGKYLNKLEKHILDSLILLNLQHLQPQLIQLQSQPS